jgi:hypothetical protein
MNEQALMQILLEHLKITELILDDHIHLSQRVENFSIDSRLVNMPATIRLLRQRAEAIVNP